MPQWGKSAKGTATLPLSSTPILCVGSVSNFTTSHNVDLPYYYISGTNIVCASQPVYTPGGSSSYVFDSSYIAVCV